MTPELRRWLEWLTDRLGPEALASLAAVVVLLVVAVVLLALITIAR